ncbi:hypothetical protein D9M72_241900 [compost metagenome]
MAHAIAAGIEADLADIELRQACLFVQPAQLAVGQRHAPLRHQPAQEAVVVLLAAGRVHHHAAHQQPALGRAPHQDVGAGRAQADELQVHAEQRTPRQLAVERGGRKQHALFGVHGAQAAGAEGWVPAVPVGIERADADLGRERHRATLFQPLARGGCLWPQHEADQQARHQRQRGQHQCQPHQRAAQPAPEWVAHGCRHAARAGAQECARACAGGTAAPGAGGIVGRGIHGVWRGQGGGGLRPARAAIGGGTISGLWGAAGHAQIIRQY